MQITKYLNFKTIFFFVIIQHHSTKNLVLVFCFVGWGSHAYGLNLRPNSYIQLPNFIRAYTNRTLCIFNVKKKYIEHAVHHTQRPTVFQLHLLQLINRSSFFNVQLIIKLYLQYHTVHITSFLRYYHGIIDAEIFICKIPL